VALAEQYAKNFAEWLGYVFMSRANMMRRSKAIAGTEEGLASWVEHLPDIMERKASPKIQSYIPASSRFLDFKVLDRLSKKVLDTLKADWNNGLVTSRTAASLADLPLAFNWLTHRYEMKGDRKTFRNRRELTDMGFIWDRRSKVWFTKNLDSDVIKDIPQAVKVTTSPTPVISISLKEWFFGDWLPKNIDRFSKVFNDYGRGEGVPYYFFFTVHGTDVDVTFRRNIKTIREAVAELKLRYGNQKDRDGWMDALRIYGQLQHASGKGAIHKVDEANNLEHTHGAMMEHFPPGVRSWYPRFLDFKYTAHPLQMVKMIRAEDLRMVVKEMLPENARRQRLTPPKLDHRTPKGLALEISSQPGKSNKRKLLLEVKKNHPREYPEVVHNLLEKGLGSIIPVDDLA